MQDVVHSRKAAHAYLLYCMGKRRQKTQKSAPRPRKPVLCSDCKQDMVHGAHPLVDLRHGIKCFDRYRCRNIQENRCSCKT